MKHTLAAAALVVLPFSLAGCGPDQSGGMFEDVDSLRDAFIEAGGNCNDWNQTNTVTGALQSGECGTTAQLSVFKDGEGVQYQITQVKNSEKAEGMGEWLTGENWIIAVDDETEHASELQSDLGGQIVSFKE